ncbi:hypothetical protein LguiA_013200 [Lonicera macranthoides]
MRRNNEHMTFFIKVYSPSSAYASPAKQIKSRNIFQRRKNEKIIVILRNNLSTSKYVKQTRKYSFKKKERENGYNDPNNLHHQNMFVGLAFVYLELIPLPVNQRQVIHAVIRKFTKYYLQSGPKEASLHSDTKYTLVFEHSDGVRILVQHLLWWRIAEDWVTFESVTVSQDGTGDFRTVQEAIDAVPLYNTCLTVVQVLPEIQAGFHCRTTVPLCNTDDFIEGEDFIAENITFEN